MNKFCNNSIELLEQQQNIIVSIQKCLRSDLDVQEQIKHYMTQYDALLLLLLQYPDVSLDKSNDSMLRYLEKQINLYQTVLSSMNTFPLQEEEEEEKRKKAPTKKSEGLLPKPLKRKATPLQKLDPPKKSKSGSLEDPNHYFEFIEYKIPDSTQVINVRIINSIHGKFIHATDVLKKFDIHANASRTVKTLVYNVDYCKFRIDNLIKQPNDFSSTYPRANSIRTGHSIMVLRKSGLEALLNRNVRWSEQDPTYYNWLLTHFLQHPILQ